jgi:hypothetical protein
MQFINPQNGETQQIQIPVSQNTYDNTKVGDGYSLTVHTVILGIQVPITNQPNAKIPMLDILPLVLPVMGIVSLLFATFRSDFKAQDCILPCIVIGIGILLMTTIRPDFIAAGSIVDKTFVISSGGF